jgi:hypothetical protein
MDLQRVPNGVAVYLGYRHVQPGDGGVWAMFNLSCLCKPGVFRIPLILLPIFLMISFGTTVAAEQDAMSLAQRSKNKRLAISAGAFFARFSSSYKYTDEGTTERIFIDLEGQLDLPTTEIVANLSALLRISGNSYLVGTYSSLRRSADRPLVKESVDIGEDIVTIDAVTSVTLNYDFVDLGYGYAFHSDESSLIIGKLGVHMFYTYASFSITGDLSVNEEEYNGRVGDETEFLFAFPLVGAAASFQISRRWSVENSVDFVYLPFGDTQGIALSSLVAARCMISETVGIQAGLSYNFERAQYKEGSVTHEVEFDFSGIKANVYLAF